ncbi:MAG: hypothetical protein AB1391_03245 [Candidatus Micrarchaeota archaeon]
MLKENVEIWNDAAKSLEFQQNFHGSAECYERARKFGDESSETLLNLAVSYIKLYRFYLHDKYLANAKNFLISGIEKDKDNPKLHHYLGMVYLALGEKETAMQEFVYESEKTGGENDTLFHFDYANHAPDVKLDSELDLELDFDESDIYKLLPDPLLYKIFDIVSAFPLDKSLLESLKGTYGERDSATLTALYLRSIYFKIFEDANFAKQLDLSADQEKWESLLVFFVRGINDDSKLLIKKSRSDEGKLDVSKLPAYTRLLIERYRREILSFSYNKESFRALINLPLKKLEAINFACEEAKRAIESGEGKRSMKTIMERLRGIGLAHKKTNNTFSLSDALVQNFEEAERFNLKFARGQYDAEFFILFYNLLKSKRFAYTLELAKKIRALYEESETIAYIKDIFSSLSLSEDEKFEIISEV